MRRTATRTSALLLAVALVATGTPAFAVEGDGDESAPATLTLTTPSTLTLPGGDGIRDLTTIWLSSDIATAASVEILGADGTSVLRSTSMNLSDELPSVPLELTVSDLPAGALSVRATPTVGEAVAVPLTVGSGRPASVKLSLSAKTIYSWSKSAKPTSVASVGAIDETGLRIPFRGTVTAKVAGKTQTLPITSATGATATATIVGSKLAAGTATVTASVNGNGSPAVKATAKLTVKSVGVLSTKLSTSTTTVYPSKDGYKDSVRLTVSASTTTGGTIPVNGTVKVTSKGKTVKSWKLSTSKKWSATWDGKVKGKIVPGSYTVSVSVKGPEGTTKTAVKNVAVKKGVLVTKTLTKTYKAKKVLPFFTPLGYSDYDQYNVCWVDTFTAGDIFCDAREADSGRFALIAHGTLSVPKTVVTAQKLGGAKVKVTAKTSRLKGSANWGYWRMPDDIGRTTPLRDNGKSTAGWLSLPATNRTLEVQFGLAERSQVAVQSLTVQYSYKILSTK